MQTVVDPAHYQVAEGIRALWATYEDNRDLISIGAYKKGSDPLIDEALAKRPVIAQLLTQRPDELVNFADSLLRAREILSRKGS